MPCIQKQKVFFKLSQYQLTKASHLTNSSSDVSFKCNRCTISVSRIGAVSADSGFMFISAKW